MQSEKRLLELNKKPMATDLQNVTKRLDTVFSLFIRLRDADKNGLVRCITSGKFIHWKEADAGHFITRNNMSTRWDERNVNAQGQQDNRFLSGKQYEHGLAIDRKFGKGTADLLLIKSKTPCKFFAFELEEKVKYYRQRVKELKQQKGLN